MPAPKENCKTQESAPYQEKQSEQGDQLPQPFRALHEGPSSVSPYSEIGKVETCKDSLEEGGRSGATSISHMVGMTTVLGHCSTEDPGSL